MEFNGYGSVEASWNVMAHAKKPDVFFRRNGGVHLNSRRRQFSRLLAAEVCASAVVMLDTTCSEVVWRVPATHSIHQFPLHFPSLGHRVPSHFSWSLLRYWRNVRPLCMNQSSKRRRRRRIRRKEEEEERQKPNEQKNTIALYLCACKQAILTSAAICHMDTSLQASTSTIHYRMNTSNFSLLN